MSGEGEKVKFKFPGKLEKLLAALSTYYAKNEKPLLQRVIVNATPSLEEGCDFDNWDGGTWGHLLHLKVPSSIFYEAFDAKIQVEEELGKDLNRLENFSGEYVANVLIELQDDPTIDGWREKSGLLLRGPAAAAISENRVSHLWEPGFLRVFLTHKSEYKKETSLLRGSLLYCGLSCFVAHEDIEPTKEWQEEIEKALFSMEVMVPLLTEGFKESDWTDQEIGVAVGRGIPVVPVRLGKDPYGFIGKYQAVLGHGRTPKVLARELIDAFLTNPAIKGRVIEALVYCFERADCFDQANELMLCLDKIESATPDIIKRLRKAPKKNSQVEGAFRVQGRLPLLLKRLGGAERTGGKR